MTIGHRIVCGTRHAGKGEGVSLRIDDRPVAASLSLSRISATLVSNLPDILADLVEIAAYVYAADAAIRRGGKVAEGMGAAWRRRLRFLVPVRCRATWERPEVAEALAETLGFLSDDHYAFEFVDHDGGSLRQWVLLELGGDEGDAEEIMMFSGGSTASPGRPRRSSSGEAAWRSSATIPLLSCSASRPISSRSCAPGRDQSACSISASR